MGHAYEYQKNLHCVLLNKTRKHKVDFFFSRQSNAKFKKYSKILSDLVILELISLNGWYVWRTFENFRLIASRHPERKEKRAKE